MKKYPGKLNKELKAKVGPGKVEVSFTFKKLHGLAQAGDLVMDLHFKANGKEFHYHGDGWDFKATCEGKPVDPTTSIAKSLGNIEDVASELVGAYLYQIAPKEDVEKWIELENFTIDKDGSLVELED